VEGTQELLVDQDFKVVTMGSKKRKWAFHDIVQSLANKFSSNLEECVPPPSCSNQDVSDPNLFKNIIQSIRLLHISSLCFSR
jgi:hypothetical protein